MKTLLALLTATGLLTLGSLASAHTDLASSTPANGTVVKDAPEKMELNFTETVRLLKFSITGSDGKAVDTGFKASADTKDQFELALPMLAEDSYTVHWSVMGADSHLVENTVAFTVDADAPEVEAATAPAAAPAQHAH